MARSWFRLRAPLGAAPCCAGRRSVNTSVAASVLIPHARFFSAPYLQRFLDTGLRDYRPTLPFMSRIWGYKITEMNAIILMLAGGADTDRDG